MWISFGILISLVDFCCWILFFCFERWRVLFIRFYWSWVLNLDVWICFVDICVLYVLFGSCFLEYGLFWIVVFLDHFSWILNFWISRYLGLICGFCLLSDSVACWIYFVWILNFGCRVLDLIFVFVAPLIGSLLGGPWCGFSSFGY